VNPVIPASYSTLCQEALGQLVSDRYGLGQAQCKFIVRGVGDTYLVETPGSRFILRVYRSSHRSRQQIMEEVQLLTALRAAGVSISGPIGDRNGVMIQEITASEGDRHAVLFSNAEGKPVSILNTKQLTNLGIEMARFHDVSSSISLGNSRWEFNANTTLFEPLRMVENAFVEDPEGYAWLQKAAKFITKKLESLNTTQFPVGYCHFDFLPKNFHFASDDKITFFDLDFFGHGWLINDLMVFWQHLCIDVFFNRITQSEADDNFNTFLEAYRSLRPVSEEELIAMPYLSLGFWLFYMGFHTTHDQFYPQVYQPAHLKMRVSFIRKHVERYCKMP
jgi:Ser/Thr protein kinase RdoA (MazF antagonist)